MTQEENFLKRGAKVRIVVGDLPNLSDAELGEIFYDADNDRLAVRTTEGWVYFTED